MVASADDLSLVFQALADPTRRAMISRLSTGSTTVGELAAPFAMSRPAISQHLKVLERAGLIERTVDGQWRRCTLRTEPLDEAAAWVERNRNEWNGRFDMLDERLRQLKGQTDA
ncbi:metalloregulator ArsR/SmtB family transcription factor [Microbacterium sp. M28]|uniref:ArsR/SmtB family transcription factor n=1 Tax=Microbacterium sp. M28 TaxID=2962064 RepID=UPI0021F44904|nr:metalloregulator ArsR/SmtB family transcription factor [Microbacterium sp. M28]UYO96962.1 metalloregulator ArsR/SmtB family transcription factor [Microbacterium sp. M28]